MSENANEKRPKEPKSSPKRFSKVRLLQIIGLLSRRFNYETLEFERSWPLRLVCGLSLIAKLFFGFQTTISYFYPQNHSVQFLLGNIFNFIPGRPRLFFGIAAATSGIWSLAFHLVFGYLNTRNDYRLFKFWMKLTHELPAKNEKDYRVAGLSREENQKFWSSENYVNHVWYRALNWYIALLTLTFCYQLFLVPFDGVEMVSVRYILVQALHILHLSYAMFSFLHCFYTLNLFYATCMRFFSKRFHHIAMQVDKLSRRSSERINRKLSRLIVDHNLVHHDLIRINEFFKYLIGFNLVMFYALGVNLIFIVLLDIDWRIKVTFFWIILFLYLTIIYFPFIMARTVTNEINRTKRLFENIAFHRPVNQGIQLKIESISNVSESTGFTCFSWFLLDPYVGLRISLEFLVTLLLIVQTYYYYSQF